MNTSEKANMLIRTGLLRPGPLALCNLKAQEVTTKGVYRLPHAIHCCASPCQTLHELLAWRPHTNSPAHQLAVPRMRNSPRVCTSVLFKIVMSNRNLLFGLWVHYTVASPYNYTLFLLLPVGMSLSSLTKMTKELTNI